MCIGLVVSAEGLPLAYEVFAGNRADVTTLQVQMVEVIWNKHRRVAAVARKGSGCLDSKSSVSEENPWGGLQRKKRLAT